MDPDWENFQGVPISAILFGGRRSSVVPLVCEAFNWQHGTFLGASISSEMTAAAEGEVGKLRHDPFAMLPFCGYHMGDYFAHWLKMGRSYASELLPRIYYVNWFRKGKDGKFLWPGFGENSRVLKWIFERVSGQGLANKTAIGYLPDLQAIDLSGLHTTTEAMQDLFHIDRSRWLQETEELRSYFTLFGNRLPPEFTTELDELEKRLSHD